MPFKWLKQYFILVFVLASIALGADAALEQQTTIELEPGTPLFQLMNRRNGIADKMDSVAKRKVTIVGWDTFNEARDGFDPRVFKKLLPMFKGRTTEQRELGLKKLIDTLEGEKLNVQNAVAAIANVMSEEGLLKDPSRVGLEATRIAPLVMLASGGGTGVTLDEHNHTYHYGYKAGENGDFDADEPSDVNRKRTKSGRSYSQSNERMAFDASDMDLLRGVSDYLENSKNPWPMYKAMFEILTKGDASRVETLPTQAQDVIADWFGVYIAEQRRHRMTGWKRMDWENALTELFMIGPYTQKAGQIRTKNGEIVDGELTNYFGVGSDGSGLGGKAGIERRKYTRAISNVMKRVHPEEYNAVADIIGMKRGGDICSLAMKWINSPAPGRQQKVVKNADALSDAMVNYLKAMKSSATEIAAELGG